VGRATQVLLAVLIVYGLVLGGSAIWARGALKHPACPPAATILLVDAATHSLCLCANGTPHRVFRVALGRGGIGKLIEGDGKTPRGSFALSDARPSSRFGLSCRWATRRRSSVSSGIPGRISVFTGHTVGFSGSGMQPSGSTGPAGASQWRRDRISRRSLNGFARREPMPIIIS
jgi:hypothetical protein